MSDERCQKCFSLLYPTPEPCKECPRLRTRADNAEFALNAATKRAEEAEGCAQESADIMRRARKRAEAAKSERDEARREAGALRKALQTCAVVRVANTADGWERAYRICAEAARAALAPCGRGDPRCPACFTQAPHAHGDGSKWPGPGGATP